MKKMMIGLVGSILLSSCTMKVQIPVSLSDSDLHFNKLSQVWDEALPLGNATVGALVWQKDSVLHLSLDRIDLWDLRPMENLTGENARFAWVYEQVQKKNYAPVQNKFDWPYDRLPAPSKIPGAAMEFPIKLGKVESSHLYLKNALSEVRWENGTTLKTFVHATEPVGWFVLENLPDTVSPVLIAPKYATKKGVKQDNSHAGPALARLGYEQGDLNKEPGLVSFHQKGWGDFYYDVAVRYKRSGSNLIGTWSITSSMVKEKAVDLTEKALERGLETDYQSHMQFWDTYWNQSSVSVPDAVLQKQYDNEMYKFGAAAREDSYPISLQSVWTADNGMLPPWKGDFHHDLNTQLSYWPAYTGNHLKEAMGYLNTLWNQRDVYKKYTRKYFETEGLNVPGVCTLTGEPMGGWIQYSMSPTVGAWLSHHFYLQWKYSADARFLKERAYPFLKDVALFLENFSKVDAKGIRKLPLSSSPEIFDNSINAWFKDMTNYDLGLMKFVFKAAEEMASAQELKEEAAHWKQIGGQLPDFALDKDGGLVFAKGFPYKQSHRHFSHAMAIHPLSLIDWSQGEKSRAIIKATIKRLDEVGPAYWCGYSYSWLGNMKARAMDGEGAAEALRTFARCFCLANTFHANGDQTKSGKSLFTYRPFTLEGNFAFASGVQEMLLQSHTGTVHLFPAIPASWKDVSFRDLRAMGGFLISAEMKDGQLVSYQIKSEQGGKIRLALPGGKDGKNIKYYNIQMKKGQEICWPEKKNANGK